MKALLPKLEQLQPRKLALTGFVALYYLGLTSTIYAAALLNVGVSAAVWRSLRTDRV